MSMYAANLHAIGDLRYEEVPMPEVGEGEALVRIAASGICGSDVPRVFTKGTYHFPTIPGHEFSGTVVDCTSDPASVGRRVAVFPLLPCGKCAMCAIGQYAMCSSYDYYGSRRNGGFAEYQAVRLENLIDLPEGLSFESGAMVEPAAVATHAVSTAALVPGESIAVFGGGPIGLMAAQLARSMGARVLLIDVDNRKLDIAAQHGWAEPVDASSDDVAEKVREMTDGAGVDVALEAAGVAATVAGALQATRAFGRVVLMGNPASDIHLRQNDYWQILRKQLTISGVWNSQHNAFRDDWIVAINAMHRGLLDPEALITHTFGLDSCKQAFEVARSRDEMSLKVMFTTGETA